MSNKIEMDTTENNMSLKRFETSTISFQVVKQVLLVGMHENDTACFLYTILFQKQVAPPLYEPNNPSSDFFN